jgi:hypothetical protein
VRDPTDELEGVSSFRHRIAAAASAALLFGAAVGFVAIARENSVGETTTTAATAAPVLVPVPATPRVPEPMPPSQTNVAAVFPALDSPTDAGRPPPPLRAAPVANPASPPRPKPMVEDSADAGPLAVMPTSARLDDGTSMPEEAAGPESD